MFKPFTSARRDLNRIARALSKGDQTKWVGYPPGTKAALERRLQALQRFLFQESKPHQIKQAPTPEHVTNYVERVHREEYQKAVKKR